MSSRTIEARSVISAAGGKKADLDKEGEGDAHPIEMSALRPVLDKPIARERSAYRCGPPA